MMPNASHKVQILDDTTANQIAAGEVIERPAAAVKELVENALDAGARQVVVELEEGGKRLLRVTDDGSGMGQADAVLALQRHATSKIRSADDLFRITTLGFRGEALPSIASVSQLTLLTKEAGQDALAGTQLRCAGGILEDVSEVGARAGTSISVENLFYNVPARLKFLKTASTELGHIVDLMQRFALARPDVALRLMQGSGEVFASGGSGSLMDACVHVFGRDTARHLVPLSFDGAGLRVTGYIGTPAALKSTRSSQHTYVNKRFVRSKAINLCEMYYHYRRQNGEATAEDAAENFAGLNVTVREDMGTLFWREVARLKTPFTLSVGDCCGLALALRLGVAFVTSDHHEFDAVAASGLCSVLFIR
jgi:DNA mismatch repair protein MutL